MPGGRTETLRGQGRRVRCRGSDRGSLIRARPCQHFRSIRDEATHLHGLFGDDPRRSPCRREDVQLPHAGGYVRKSRLAFPSVRMGGGRCGGRGPRQVAELVNADPKEIVWTSGATESDNLAIKGAAHFYHKRASTSSPARPSTRRCSIPAGTWSARDSKSPIWIRSQLA